MAHLFDTPVSAAHLALLLLALLVAYGFEFVNGFHDTANAVATVIYTKSLKPWYAVIISGAFNFMGVYLGGIAVAMSIIKLLPVELLATSGGAGMAMVLALLCASIVWNIGTWYFGLPASSSHTLIGAIVGVGLANSMLPGHAFGSGVNWSKVQEIASSLVLSPIVGLTCAALLLLLIKRFLPMPTLHTSPDGNKPPPWWVRGVLITTCSGVSFAHGSNDGQKGVGLLMLILIGMLPADYALNRSLSHAQITAMIQSTDKIELLAENLGQKAVMAANGGLAAGATVPAELATDLDELRTSLQDRTSLAEIPPDQRFEVRKRIMRVDSELGHLEKSNASALSPEQWSTIKKERSTLRAAVDFAPSWVLIGVAMALGIGTMVGWKRIVVTIGEKIGKTHMTYSQGASAEVVAATTIGLSGWLGLPVSTTHVLSSGIAGTMVASKSGLQSATVRNIALAWVLTLPVAMGLGGLLFLGFRAIIPNANAATPAVHFDPHSEESSVVVNASASPLRIHGSNTIGAELAPALARAFLEQRRAEGIRVDKSPTGLGWVVSGTLPGEKAPMRFEIDASGSEAAFEDLANGTADLGMASRAVTTQEAERLRRAGAGDLTAQGGENVIGLDGLAVIVSASNPTGPLSTDVIGSMFSGQLASWPPESHGTGPVHLFARDDRSGTYATFKAAVLGERALAPSAARFADSGKLSDAVAADPQGIGFVGMPYIRQARAVAVSESQAAPVVPTPFTVATEDYPLSRRLYLYAPSPARHPLSQDFVSFTLSPKGQAVVAAHGFVDLGARSAEAAASCGTTCPPAYTATTRGAKRLSIDFRFASGTSQLDARGQRDLGRLVAYLRTLRSPNVKLLGFSDPAGDPSANVSLSRERASKIADLLTARGIDVKTVDGFGGVMPVADNDTEPHRQRNRRVEVWVSES
ncbi:MAG: inorganic phosphate transporter [Polyangiaceae bacterium]|jgi:PiT family inorganic phosphate transporter